MLLPIRMKTHMTMQARAIHTPAMIPVMDLWSRVYRPSEKAAGSNTAES